MDEELIDSDSLSLSRKSQLPGAGFFYPDTLDEERADEQAREAVEGAEAVVVADSGKFGRRGFRRICGVEEIDLLITDDAAPDSFVRSLEDLGVEVRVV